MQTDRLWCSVSKACFYFVDILTTELAKAEQFHLI